MIEWLMRYDLPNGYALRAVHVQRLTTVPSILRFRPLATVPSIGRDLIFCFLRLMTAA